MPREITERVLKEIDHILESDSDEVQSKYQAAKLRQSLLRHDQLLRTISEGQAFPDFAEAEISFPPTFKFDKGTRDYDTSHKNRIPAYTDRILFKPNGVQVIEYDSVQDAVHSDHRPVYASLILPLVGREQDLKMKAAVGNKDSSKVDEKTRNVKKRRILKRKRKSTKRINNEKK